MAIFCYFLSMYIFFGGKKNKTSQATYKDTKRHMHSTHNLYIRVGKKLSNLVVCVTAAWRRSRASLIKNPKNRIQIYKKKLSTLPFRWFFERDFFFKLHTRSNNNKEIVSKRMGSESVTLCVHITMQLYKKEFNITIGNELRLTTFLYDFLPTSHFNSLRFMYSILFGFVCVFRFVNYTNVYVWTISFGLQSSAQGEREKGAGATHIHTYKFDSITANFYA